MNKYALFPFQQQHPELAYLDSSATAQLPQVVLEAMQNYWLSDHANVHRSSHLQSARATECYEQSRFVLANFLGCLPEQFIFTESVTAGLNGLAQTFGRYLNLQAGDEIVVSALEHHANFLPWQQICKHYGATLRVLPVSRETGLIHLEQAEFSARTKLVALSAASNVTGVVQPIEALTYAAKKVDAVVIIDAAQLGHLNPKPWLYAGVDALTIASHKLYGPTGIAGLYLASPWLNALAPWRLGGGMVESVTAQNSIFTGGVQRFEGGTPNVAAAVGFAAAVKWLQHPAQQQNYQRLLRDFAKFKEELKKRNWLQLLPSGEELPIVSIYSNEIQAFDLALWLDQKQIAVRAGEHCAHPLFAHWKLPATLRFSAGLYTQPEHLMRSLAALDEAYEVFSG